MVRTRWTQTMVMAVYVMTFMGSWAYGQTGDNSASSILAGPWTVDVAPYLWLPVPSGSVTIGDRTVHLSHDLGDTLDLLFDGNFSVIGGMGRVEARKGHLLFTTNVVYLHIDEQEKATSLGVKTEVPFNYLNTEFGVGYRLATWSLPSSVRPSVSVDALAGGRYVSLQPGITVTGPRGREVDVERDVDWLEAYVGGRGLLTLAERFTFGVQGDIGGFGAGSQFTWNVEGVFLYRVARVVSLGLGYRALGTDYRRGSGAAKFTFDMLIHGPLLGAVFQF
jgi:hypothetical protein